MLEVLGAASGSTSLIVALLLIAKDYRQTRADARLAEETVGARSALATTTAEEARFVLITKTWTEERDSLNRQLDDLRERLNVKDAEIAAHNRTVLQQGRHIAEQDAEILELRDQLFTVQAQARALIRQVDILSRRLAELGNENSPENQPDPPPPFG